ncbi:MAG: fused MFS/spermidine synthase [Actinomycetota bacterium]|nr:fused MFS/spermidine synthase [Actinomycetota bacterium]
MPSLAAGFLVFFTSAAVLVLEILAGRLLAPYVGVSLETYTGIIGTVLAGISLGSWLGGRVADRVAPRSLLGPLVAAGGVLALLAPVWVAVFGAGLRGTGPVGIVVLAFVGFFAPAVVLSAVNPAVVKLQLDDLGETGTVVGRFAAIGTAGAIVGTFVTGFLLVASLPSDTIVLGLGGSLVLVGVVLWWVLRPTGTGGVAWIVAVGVFAALLTVARVSPCQYESAYFCARVVADSGRTSGRLLLLDTVRHSYMDLADPTRLEFAYAQTVSDVLATVAPAGEPLDVLSIGGGGFTLPRYVAATRPESTNLVLELDPMLVEIARQELGLVTGPELRVRVGDARLTLRDVPSRAFDVIIGDAFGGLAVPWHLTTLEFLEEVKARLRPDGVYVMNLIDYPPLGFARAETNTLQQVFSHVAVFAPPAHMRGEAGGNFVLVASDTPIQVAAILEHNWARGGGDTGLTGAALEPFVAGAPVLTDDYAPVDQLMTPRG